MGGIQPNLQEFVVLARQGSVVPVTRELLADALTPVLAYASVGERLGSFLLESAALGGEYSFVGFDPELTVRGLAGRIEEQRPDGMRVRMVPDPWQALRELMSQYRPAKVAWLPCFWGGAVGYVSPSPSAAEPLFVLSIATSLLIFDHRRQTVRVVVLARIDDHEDLRDTYAAALTRIDAALQRLAQPVRLRSIAPPPPDAARASIPLSSFDDRAFDRAVAQCSEQLRAGKLARVALSRTFRTSSAGVDSFDVYRALRVVHATPYLYFLRFAQQRIAGASAGPLLRVEHGSAELHAVTVIAAPGYDPLAPAAHALPQRAFEAASAEHALLIESARSDLATVAAPLDVHVTTAPTDRGPADAAICSRVDAPLSAGRDAIDVLRAVLPSAAATGIPRTLALQLTEALEPEPRGLHGGAAGYLGFDGSLVLVATARALVEQGGEWSLQTEISLGRSGIAAAAGEQSLKQAASLMTAIISARGA